VVAYPKTGQLAIIAEKSPPFNARLHEILMHTIKVGVRVITAVARRETIARVCEGWLAFAGRIRLGKQEFHTPS